jgi:hypothetical protein
MNAKQRILPADLPPLSGSESLKGTTATVADFWRWGFSDLRLNITRGVLAEFLVKLAVGDKTAIRSAWSNHDVIMPPNTTIEVKSSAYLQSWPQKALSKIGFSGLTGRTWLEDGSFSVERELRSEIYVFAIQKCQVSGDYDPLDVSQWEFRALRRDQLKDRAGRSIRLPFLESHALPAVRWAELKAAIVALNSHR